MPSPLIAAIPYTTFPSIGPIQTFGLMVALGVVAGIWFAASWAEQYGMTRDETYSLGTRMVLAGVVGARLTWVLTHLDQISSPLDVIAVWEGGLQFSGGFLAAIAVGLPTFLTWNRLQRWQLLDGFSTATVLGAAFGRIGCTAVGEHFGRQSDFFLAVRWEGGATPDVREPFLGLDPGAAPVAPGVTFHNTAIYEGLWLFLLFGILWWVLKKVKPTPGTVAAMFLVGYGVARFSFDSLRVNDERVAGLTGAQWMCLGMMPVAAYILLKVRPANAAALAAGEVGGIPVAESTTTETASGQAITTTKRKKRTPARAGAAPTGGGEASDPDADADVEDAEGTEAEEVDGAVPLVEGTDAEGTDAEGSDAEEVDGAVPLVEGTDAEDSGTEGSDAEEVDGAVPLVEDTDAEDSGTEDSDAEEVDASDPLVEDTVVDAAATDVPVARGPSPSAGRGPDAGADDPARADASPAVDDPARSEGQGSDAVEPDSAGEVADTGTRDVPPDDPAEPAPT